MADYITLEKKQQRGETLSPTEMAICKVFLSQRLTELGKSQEVVNTLATDESNERQEKIDRSERLYKNYIIELASDNFIFTGRKNAIEEYIADYEKVNPERAKELRAEAEEARARRREFVLQ